MTLATSNQQPAAVLLLTTSLPIFDLTLVRNKLIRESRQRWAQPLTETEALECEQEYREYLAQVKEYPGQSHSPSKKADLMWHTHILYMRQYFRDCMDYLGRVLFHNPFEPSARKNVCDDECGCGDCGTCGCDSVRRLNEADPSLIIAKGDCTQENNTLLVKASKADCTDTCYACDDECGGCVS